MNHTDLLMISSRNNVVAEITRCLEPEGVGVSNCERWQQAQPIIGEQCPQLVLLDSPGAGINGLSLCREIRSRYQGLLMLLAEDDEQLHTLALGMGVDASFAETTGPALVAAQVKALLRRFVPHAPPTIQIFDNLTIDSNKRDVFVGERAAQLSTIEFNLLWTLVRHAGSVVSRDEIHRELYNSPYNGYDRGIDIYVSRIRSKIGDDPIVPTYLKTVRGAGYQFMGVCEAASVVNGHS